MVGISLVILVLAARLLYLVDQSLREGEGMGLSGEGAIETIPILVLLGLLIWMVARSGTNTKVDTGASDTQLIGIMLGMFLLGLYIGPGISLSLDCGACSGLSLQLPFRWSRPPQGSPPQQRDR